MARSSARGAGGKQVRRDSFVDAVPFVLVACEGKTEQKVLDGLRTHLRLPSVKVEVRGQCGNTLSVLDAALEMRKEKLKSLPKRDLARDSMETWAVFDRDEHPETRWSQAFAKAAAQVPPVRMAQSNPCIELWAILLYRDQTAHIERGDAQKALAVLMAGYHHEKAPFFNIAECLASDISNDTARWELAGQRARAIAVRRAKDGDPLGNPSTDFDLLVAELFAIANKAWRITASATRKAPSTLAPSLGTP